MTRRWVTNVRNKFSHTNFIEASVVTTHHRVKWVRGHNTKIYECYSVQPLQINSYGVAFE